MLLIGMIPVSNLSSFVNKLLGPSSTGSLFLILLGPSLSLFLFPAGVSAMARADNHILGRLSYVLWTIMGTSLGFSILSNSERLAIFMQTSKNSFISSGVKRLVSVSAKDCESMLLKRIDPI